MITLNDIDGLAAQVVGLQAHVELLRQREEWAGQPALPGTAEAAADVAAAVTLLRGLGYAVELPIADCRLPIADGKRQPAALRAVAIVVADTLAAMSRDLCGGSPVIPRAVELTSLEQSLRAALASC